MNLKNFSKNVTVLNLLLISIIYLLYAHTLAPLADNGSMSLPSAKAIPFGEMPKPAEIQSPSFSDFMVVGEMNLFHPERHIPTEKAITESRPEIILYGTIVSEDMKVAYVGDKKIGSQTVGREKKQRAMKLGENIGGYVLKTIEVDSVTFVKGDDKITVSVKDGRNNRRTMARESGASHAFGPSPAGRKDLPESQRPQIKNNHAAEPLKLESRRPQR